MDVISDPLDFLRMFGLQSQRPYIHPRRPCMAGLSGVVYFPGTGGVCCWAGIEWGPWPVMFLVTHRGLGVVPSPCGVVTLAAWSCK